MARPPVAGRRERHWRDPGTGWSCPVVVITGDNVSLKLHKRCQSTPYQAVELIFDASKRRSSAVPGRWSFGQGSALVCPIITLQEYMDVSAQETNVASLAGRGAAFGLWGWGRRQRRKRRECSVGQSGCAGSGGYASSNSTPPPLRQPLPLPRMLTEIRARPPWKLLPPLPLSPPLHQPPPLHRAPIQHQNPLPLRAPPPHQPLDR